MSKIGDYKMFHSDGQGWYVAKLCPLNTSDPQPTNAFWQQVSKYYKYAKYAERILVKLSIGWDSIVKPKC